jgi:hypothetical protein
MPIIQVRGEITGSPNCRNVGESQTVPRLHPAIISPHTRTLPASAPRRACFSCARRRAFSACGAHAAHTPTAQPDRPPYNCLMIRTEAVTEIPLCFDAFHQRYLALLGDQRGALPLAHRRPPRAVVLGAAGSQPCKPLPLLSASLQRLDGLARVFVCFGLFLIWRRGVSGSTEHQPSTRANNETPEARSDGVLLIGSPCLGSCMHSGSIKGRTTAAATRSASSALS